MSQQFGTYDLVLRSGVDPTTGGVAVCGFTTAGMVGVIATSHIIESLGLTQLGTVMDERFPAVALIQNEVPRHPVRVYQGNGIGVFTAEIQFEKEQDIAFGSSGAPTTLISDKSRVYKGGSWADRSYWLSSGNRRFLDEDKSSDAIGFRCAMDRLGSPTGNRKK